MTKIKSLMIKMIVIGLTSGQLLYGQLFIKDIFVGVGYCDSKLTELNSIIDTYPINDTVGFKTINGFLNTNLGFSLGFQKFKKFSIELSYDRLGISKQSADYATIKGLSEIIINLNPDDESSDFFDLNFGDTTYRYGYKLNTSIFSINPKYKLISIKKISLSYGIGLNLTKCNLIQNGFGLEVDTFNIETKSYNETFSRWIISWQSNLTISYNLIDNLMIGLQIQYRDNKIKNIGGYDFYKNFYSQNHSNNVIYPIMKTTIDYSGLNYLIRLKYIFKFKTKNASS